LKRFKEDSTLSFVAGVGATTPLSSQDVVVTYMVPAAGTVECSTLIQRFSPQNIYNSPVRAGTGSDCLAGGYSEIAFSNQDRSNFLVKYGAGFRYVSTTRCKPSDVNCSPFHGSADFTVGQDESVTGGSLHHLVFKVDVLYPLPFQDGILYLFGTAELRDATNKDLSPLILQAATGTPTLPSSSVLVLPLQQADRDFYRLGVGLNLITLFDKLKGNSSAPPAANK
jgi:hypothetical protein